MRRRVLWLIVGVPLALLVAGAGTALSLPWVRHVISGFWNLPDRLPALADNAQVHYQPGAEHRSCFLQVGQATRSGGVSVREDYIHSKRRRVPGEDLEVLVR